MKSRISTLILDDEIVTAQLYAKALEQRGIDVLVAVTGEEALEFAERYRPKLIICDVEMPLMTGPEFCQKLISSGHKNCPLVFFTGRDDISVLQQGLRSGGDDFMIKGGKVEGFIRRVNFWLTSGFISLPQTAREKAISLVELELSGQENMIKDGVRIDLELLRSLVEKVNVEMKLVGPHYGERLIERVFFMGRLSHLVLEACNSVGSVVRFPDYFYGAARQISHTWAKDMNEILGHYDEYALDPRFQEAAVNGLIEIKD